MKTLIRYDMCVFLYSRVWRHRYMTYIAKWYHSIFFFKFGSLLHYNVVGVAVALVISTTHDKACIDSHSAQKFKKTSKISHSHISQSQWWNCGRITFMNLLSYHNYAINAIIQNGIFYQIEREFLFELSLISLKTMDTRYTKRIIQIISH